MGFRKQSEKKIDDTVYLKTQEDNKMKHASLSRQKPINDDKESHVKEENNNSENKTFLTCMPNNQTEIKQPGVDSNDENRHANSEKEQVSVSDKDNIKMSLQRIQEALHGGDQEYVKMSLCRIEDLLKSTLK